MEGPVVNGYPKGESNGGVWGMGNSPERELCTRFYPKTSKNVPGLFICQQRHSLELALVLVAQI